MYAILAVYQRIFNQLTLTSRALPTVK